MAKINFGQCMAQILAVVLLLWGCSDPHRDFGPSNPDPIQMVNAVSPVAQSANSTEGLPTPSALFESDRSAGDIQPEPGALGATCVTAADCAAPGFCVDGACCSSACTEICAACNLPGQRGVCSAAPSDSACPPVTCSGQSTECRHVDASQLAINCEAFGKCRTSGDCATLPESVGSACAEGEGTCDGTGACRVVGKASLGATCAMDGDCAEGHCVDGAEGARICCDASCDGVCQACAPSGHCDAIPPVDSRCPAVACPPDNVCLDYPVSLDAGGCRSFGQCRSPQDCAGVQLRPAAECSCDAAGSCSLRPGMPCGAAGQCQSGVCLATALSDQVCCARACGPGLFCSSDGSGCVACEGSSVECSGNSARRCATGTVAVTNCLNGCSPGIGCNALPPVGFPCLGGQCAGTAVCQQDVTATARCCSRNCAAEGKVCAADGSCACKAGQTAVGNTCLLRAGDPCSTGNQCGAGLSCTDGVCCQEACAGACERCEAGTGACVAVAQGQSDGQCSGTRQCNGARGDCRTRLRQACSSDAADTECASSNCEPVVGGRSAICCAQNCTGTRAFCKSDGSACVQCETNADCGNGCNATMGQCNPLLDIGRNCGSSSQCVSGASCLLDQGGQTRCCERNCAANGQVCNASGRCVVPTVGAGQQCVVGVVNCSGNFQCINGTCQLPTVGNGQACGAAAVCNGSAGLQCLSGVCNCPNGQSFAQGRCRRADGQQCGQASDCASGQCTLWLVDADGDGFGSLESVGGFPARSVCGAPTDTNRPRDFVAVRGCFGNDVSLTYQPGGPRRQDCCDSLGVRCGQQGVVFSSEAFPGRITPGSFGQAGATPADCGTQNNIPFKSTLDFDCDGVLEAVEQPQPTTTIACGAAPTNISAAACSARSGFFIVACGETTFGQGCALDASGACASVGPFSGVLASASCL